VSYFGFRIRWFGVWGFRFGQQQAVTDAYQYLHSNEARIFFGEAYWKANKKFQSNQKLIVLPSRSRSTPAVPLSLSVSICVDFRDGNYIFMAMLWLLQIAKAKRLRTHCHLARHSIAVKRPSSFTLREKSGYKIKQKERNIFSLDTILPSFFILFNFYSLL